MKKRINSAGVIQRFIEQIGIYNRNEGKGVNEIMMLAENGSMTQRGLPQNIEKKFLQDNIHNPFRVTGRYEDWQ